MRIGQRALHCLLFLALLAGCASEADVAEPRMLVVFAAASLTEAFGELGQQFEALHPGVQVRLNFAGSQQLRAQLLHGARADVFASANMAEMDAVVGAGLVQAGVPRVFAQNRLVLIYPPDNPGRLSSLADLARPGVSIDIADPAVPAGRYTLALLEAANADPSLGPQFKERVLANVVSYEENIRAVVSKVRLGEVDAGVVYVSDVSGTAASEIGRLELPEAINQPASYPIAPLAQAAQPELAQQFIAFVLAAQGQQVLGRYGFIPIQTGRP